MRSRNSPRKFPWKHICYRGGWSEGFGEGRGSAMTTDPGRMQSVCGICRKWVGSLSETLHGQEGVQCEQRRNNALQGERTKKEHHKTRPSSRHSTSLFLGLKHHHFTGERKTASERSICRPTSAHTRRLGVLYSLIAQSNCCCKSTSSYYSRAPPPFSPHPNFLSTFNIDELELQRRGCHR